VGAAATPGFLRQGLRLAVKITPNPPAPQPLTQKKFTTPFHRTRPHPSSPWDGPSMLLLSNQHDNGWTSRPLATGRDRSGPCDSAPPRGASALPPPPAHITGLQPPSSP
jgi:hypothetical protein